MKFSARTIIILAVICLAIANPAPAQNTSTYTISGQVGVGGVTMQGLPGNPGTGPSGRYSVLVQYGWSGTVTPVKEGYIFEPAGRTYNNLVSDLNEQNYQGEILTFTISGSIGMRGVELTGLPGNPVTDERGMYSSSIPYGWAGTVEPKKDGFNFDPPNRSYYAVTKDLANQDYEAEFILLTISGDVGQPGVVLNGLPGNPVSGRDGTYRTTVEYGWSGIVEPFKEGFSFNPPHRQYDNVDLGLTGENYWPAQVASIQMFGGSGSRKTIVIPTSEVKAEQFETTMEDMQVMMHIFEEKVINEPGMIRGILMDYGEFFGQDNQSSKAVYIQSYGALFMMEVDFPLIFRSGPQPEEPAQPREDVDPVWQRAREQVFSPEDETPGMMPGAGPEAMQQSVEQLKREFIRALKHASNIRYLGQDECVILNVTGRAQRSVRSASVQVTQTRRSGRGGRGMTSSTSSRTRRSSDDMYNAGGRTASSSGRGGYGGAMMGGYGAGMMGGGYGGGMTVDASSTVLTIRASKSDIDAFANNEIGFDEFQSKVQVFVY